MEPTEYAYSVMKVIPTIKKVAQELDWLMLIDKTGEIAKIKGRYMDATAPIIEELRAHVRDALLDGATPQESSQSE